MTARQEQSPRDVLMDMCMYGTHPKSDAQQAVSAFEGSVAAHAERVAASAAPVIAAQEQRIADLEAELAALKGGADDDR